MQAFELPRVAARLVLLGLVTSSLMGACGSTESERIRAASLSDGCTLNTDCESPLVCAFKRCHTECETSRDCEEGQRCVASDRPYHVCQLADETQCTRNSECPDRMVCGVDGECRDACVTSRDCVVGQECVSRTCVEPAELVDGALVPVDDVELAQSRPCLWNSDCPEPEVCREGSCARECRETRDCAFGDTCVEGRCASPSTPPVPPAVDAGAAPECVYSSDCAASLVCRVGRCVDECRNGRDCPSGLRCESGSCVTVALEGGTVGGGGSGPITDSGAAGCRYNSDCVVGQICDSGDCRCECRLDRDCSAGYGCDGCACQVVRPVDAPPDYGAACTLTSECLYPLVCQNGKCAYECNLSTDCSGGYCCWDHQCTTGSVCQAAGDGGAPGGDACQACASNFACDDGLWCNGQEICWAGCCAPALDTPCNSHSSCVLDLCDERAHTCRSTPQASEDADGDGHLDLGCGGDDCNDLDARIYLGAPELCDGKDNDCDGVRDEGSRPPFGPLISMATGTNHTNVAVAPVDAGWIGFQGFCGTNAAALRVQAFAPDGTPTDSITSGQAGAPNVSIGWVCSLKAASGANRAVAAYQSATASSTAQSWLTTWTLDPSVDAAGPTLNHIRSIALNSPVFSGKANQEADVAWTGSDFVVGYVTTVEGYGFLARVDTEGNPGTGAAVETPDGTGAITGRIRVAASGATNAALYQQRDNPAPPTMTIFDLSAGVIAGPIPMPSADGATILGLAGVTGGYVAAWLDATGTHTTFVSLAGVLGATYKAPSGVSYVGGDGASDAGVALFAFEGNSQVAYGSTDGTYPLSMTTVLTSVGVANVAGAGGRFAVSAGATGRIDYKQVGCLPTP